MTHTGITLSCPTALDGFLRSVEKPSIMYSLKGQNNSVRFLSGQNRVSASRCIRLTHISIPLAIRLHVTPSKTKTAVSDFQPHFAPACDLSITGTIPVVPATSMKLKHILTVLIAVSLLTPAATAYTSAQDSTPTSDTDAQPPSLATSNVSEDYIRLYVEDEYRNLDLKPGESESFSVTVENGEDSAIELSPHVFVPKMGNVRPVKPSWVTIGSGDRTLEPDEEREFEISVDVPETADLANYRGTIAFTNATVSYENRPPRPVHTARFSLNVYKEPIVRITSGDYLNAQVEAGETVERTITINNTGEQAVPLNPQFQIDSHRRHAGGPDRKLQRSWIDIDAPSQVPAGETVDVTVTIEVPENAATGYYDKEFTLGLKDPHRQDEDQYWQRIDLSLQVWKQPQQPFETTVSVRDSTESVSLTVTSHRYDRGQEQSETEQPTFDVVFVSPNGTAVTPEQVSLKTSGSVSLADDRRRGGSDGTYATDGPNYEMTYRVSDPVAGDWSVKIMPHNAMNFRYDIVQRTDEK